MSSMIKSSAENANEDIAEVMAIENTNASIIHGINAVMPFKEHAGAGMMPNVLGVGTVEMKTTDDPKLQCYIADCNNVGSSVCHWYNWAWCSTPDGGCNRRYCYSHRFEKMHTFRYKHCCKVQEKVYVFTSCTNCGAEAQGAFEKNIVGWGKWLCLFLVMMIVWPMLTNGMFQLMFRLNYD